MESQYQLNSGLNLRLRLVKQPVTLGCEGKLI